MQNKNRVFALLLALVMALAASGCAKKEAPAASASASASAASEERPTLSAAELAEATENAPDTEVYDPGDLVLAATGVASDEIVAVVDGNSAPAELVAYEIGYIGSYLDYMFRMEGQGEFDIRGTKLDGREAAEFVRTEAFNMVKQQLVLENLCKEYGLTLSAAALTQIDEQYKDDREYYGMDGFIAEIHKLGLTEEGYDRVTRAGYLYPMLLDTCADPESPLYADDETIAAFAAEQGYITADHILIPSIDLATMEPLSDEEAAANRAQIEDLLWQLRDSRDPVALFKKLADEYSQDTGRLANPDGYTFKEGTMVENFDYSARLLEEGEYSDIVETEYGYHIILRKPLDVAAAADAARDDYYDRIFTAEVDKADMELTAAAEKIDAVAVYEAITAAQGGLGQR